VSLVMNNCSIEETRRDVSHNYGLLEIEQTVQTLIS